MCQFEFDIGTCYSENRRRVQLDTGPVGFKEGLQSSGT
jgi:hypothetical protein